MQTIYMAIALLAVAVILLFIVRAAHTLTTVASFKKAWAQEASVAPAEDALVIAVLGDSTAQGIGGVRRQDGFVSQVAARISKSINKPVHLINLSVSGADSGQLLEEQMPQLKKISRYDAILIAIGPNDITHKKSLKFFLSNYEEILSQLPAEKVVISNMPPMGPKDIDGKSSRDWSLALKPLAEKYKVRLAPVYENVAPRQNDFRTYGGDFFHPSKSGYTLWADAFTPQVEKVLK